MNAIERAKKFLCDKTPAGCFFYYTEFYCRDYVYDDRRDIVKSISELLDFTYTPFIDTVDLFMNVSDCLKFEYERYGEDNDFLVFEVLPKLEEKGIDVEKETEEYTDILNYPHEGKEVFALYMNRVYAAFCERKLLSLWLDIEKEFPRLAKEVEREIQEEWE